MRTIWKFALDLYSIKTNEVEMPQGARVLWAHPQGDGICIWALVDTGAAQKEKRRFRIFGTGHTIPDEISEGYVGSVQTEINRTVFVWHVFETTGLGS